MKIRNFSFFQMVMLLPNYAKNYAANYADIHVNSILYSLILSKKLFAANLLCKRLSPVKQTRYDGVIEVFLVGI